MNVKDLIKSKRIEQGYTMKELADKVGVSEATISRWESGSIATMKQTKIAALARALNISPADLVPGTIENTELSFSKYEIEHIKKYRKLDAEGKRAVDDMIDFKLFQQSQKDSSTENKVG